MKENILSKNVRKRARELTHKNAKACTSSTLILPKSTFKFSKGHSSKTHITTHDYTGMLVPNLDYLKHE